MKIFLQNALWGRVSLLRQTSQYSGTTANADYFIRKEMKSCCDYALILDPRERSELIGISTQTKVVFVQMENREIWEPSSRDLEGIDIVISPYMKDPSRNADIHYIKYFPCVPWFYGIMFATDKGLIHQPLKSRLELDEMRCIEPKKSKLLSVIVSGKSGTVGHKWRRDVAVAIKGAFGELVDIFGFGENPVADKRTALDPYMYSLVIENSLDSYYVTEKVVDCLIAKTIPIYSGAYELDILLETMIPRIQYGCSPEKAVADVKRIIWNTTMSDTELRHARTKALNSLNIFDALPELLGE